VLRKRGVDNRLIVLVGLGVDVELDPGLRVDVLNAEIGVIRDVFLLGILGDERRDGLELEEGVVVARVGNLQFDLGLDLIPLNLLPDRSSP
jgi:hypothetical protein